MYSPYDGVVKEIVVPEEETAHLEKALVILEVEDEATGGGVTSYTHCHSSCLTACYVHVTYMYIYTTRIHSALYPIHIVCCATMLW